MSNFALSCKRRLSESSSAAKRLKFEQECSPSHARSKYTTSDDDDSPLRAVDGEGESPEDRCTEDELYLFDTSKWLCQGGRHTWMSWDTEETDSEDISEEEKKTIIEQFEGTNVEFLTGPCDENEDEYLFYEKDQDIWWRDCGGHYMPMACGSQKSAGVNQTSSTMENKQDSPGNEGELTGRTESEDCDIFQEFSVSQTSASSLSSSQEMDNSQCSTNSQLSSKGSQEKKRAYSIRSYFSATPVKQIHSKKPDPVDMDMDTSTAEDKNMRNINDPVENTDSEMLKLAYCMAAKWQKDVVGLDLHFFGGVTGDYQRAEIEEECFEFIVEEKGDEDEENVKRILSVDDSEWELSQDSQKFKKISHSSTHTLQLKETEFSSLSMSDQEDCEAGWFNSQSSESIDIEPDPGDAFRRRMLPPSLCIGIFNCLTVDDGLENGPDEQDEGWQDALEIMRLVVNPYNYFSAAVLHRVMIEAMRDHSDPSVRVAAYDVLLNCFQLFSYGPGRTAGNRHFIYLMSVERPFTSNWSFSETLFWTFLKEVLDRALRNQKSDTAPDPTDGISLLLSFIVGILSMDLQLWYDYYVKKDAPIKMPPEKRPLLATALFSNGSVQWNRRCSSVCGAYISALEQGVNPYRLTSLRKLVGVLGQLLGLAELTRHSNTAKVEMSRCLGFAVNSVHVESAVLARELFLLEPGWLSAAMSAFCLAKMRNVAVGQKIPGLRDLIENYVNVKIIKPATNQADTNMTQVSNDLKLSPGAKNKATPGLAIKNRPKIKINQRNQYGETPLHTACKRGNVAKVEECLATPGVDVNCQDHQGYTALHEAVNHNRIGAVRLLLNYVPPQTLDRFVVATPSKGNTDSVRPRRNGRVNFLLMGGDTDQVKKTALHEAVEYGFHEILEEILGFLARKQQQPKQGQSLGEVCDIPTIAEVLQCKSADGKTMADFATHPDVKAVLRKYQTMANTSVSVKRPIELMSSNVKRFSVLLNNSVVRYMSSNCLPQAYRIWVICQRYPQYKPEVLRQAFIAGEEVAIPEELEKWLPLNFHAGFCHSDLGRFPRFDVYRDRNVQATDCKDFEKIRFHEKLLKEFVSGHPLMETAVVIKSAAKAEKKQRALRLERQLHQKVAQEG